MLYTVAQISEELGLSKVTIYNKIKLLKSDLKGCIKHDKGVMCLDSKGLLILKHDLGLITLQSDFKQDTPTVESTSYADEFKDLKEDIKTLKTGQQDYIDSLLDQIEHLKLQMIKKDEQLNIKDVQIEKNQKLIENSQILLRENQNNILELESQEQKEVRESKTKWQKFKDIFNTKLE